MSMTRYDGDCGWEEENISCFGKTRRKFASRLQLSLECFEDRILLDVSETICHWILGAWIWENTN